VIDPLTEERSFVSPYNFVQNNPISRFDPNGALDAPIYDKDANFLGTDDQGLQGKAIVMDKDKFTQGMSHEEALSNSLGAEGLSGDAATSKLLTHYENLKSRPDYDGEMSYRDLLQWGRENGNSPVFLDASKIDLGDLSVSDFDGVGSGKRINTVGCNTPLDTNGTWGKNYMKLMSSDGKVKLSKDSFDYRQHDLKDIIKDGPKTIAYEFLIRIPAISTLQVIHNVNNRFGFDLNPYGYGQLKK